ncbi:uncharacterized protein B0I36DRAFT_324718 [Microdochium trichocladiopsis]|uniref:Uncharacterized protein n=1 Tax=Microdochium trichocladiopsis TaxID=1682393 RepID=A0A9P9BPB1_9PEZI|nr:uncharacterized protein B0I36DRAFT_324718 [Microdochium trichocladiopsis]KAH7028885.1 hypothetical protein B0I36DRAFT_324718 [Microdochium trichocladiopsis]
MFFHCAVLDLFLPLCDRGQSRQRLYSWQSEDSSAEAICRASTNQLKHILVDCRLHRHRALASLCTAAFIRVSNAMLRDAGRGHIMHARQMSSESGGGAPVRAPAVDPEWRFYFLLCLANCQDMLICFTLAAPLMRGLLANAMQQGVMSAAEAKTIVVNLEARATSHAAEALWEDFGEVLLDLNHTAVRPMESQTSKISGKFEELVAFQDFTIDEDFMQPGEGSGGAAQAGRRGGRGSRRRAAATARTGARQDGVAKRA